MAPVACIRLCPLALVAFSAAALCITLGTCVQKTCTVLAINY